MRPTQARFRNRDSFPGQDARNHQGFNLASLKPGYVQATASTLLVPSVPEKDS